MQWNRNNETFVMVSYDLCTLLPVGLYSHLFNSIEQLGFFAPSKRLLLRFLSGRRRKSVRPNWLSFNVTKKNIFSRILSSLFLIFQPTSPCASLSLLDRCLSMSTHSSTRLQLRSLPSQRRRRGNLSPSTTKSMSMWLTAWILLPFAIFSIDRQISVVSVRSPAWRYSKQMPEAKLLSRPRCTPLLPFTSRAIAQAQHSSFLQPAWPPITKDPNSKNVE